MSDREAALQELEDRLAIADLVHRYASTVDTPERLAAGEWVACFTDDAIFDYPWGYFEGKEGVTEGAQEVLAPNHFGQHLITNIVVELDGDVAKGRADFFVTQVRDHEDGTGHFHQGGYYLQEFRRTPDGWRITRCSVRPMWRSPMLPTRRVGQPGR